MIIIRFPDGASGQMLQNLSGKQKEIYDQLDNSLTMFEYDTTFQLLFEIKLRENIIEAALKLKDASVAFTSFKYSRFNPVYWTKGPRGYLLNPNVRPCFRVLHGNGCHFLQSCPGFYKAVGLQLFIHGAARLELEL